MLNGFWFRFGVAEFTTFIGVIVSVLFVLAGILVAVMAFRFRPEVTGYLHEAKRIGAWSLLLVFLPFPATDQPAVQEICSGLRW